MPRKYVGDKARDGKNAAFYRDLFGYVEGVGADGIGSRMFGGRVAAGIVRTRDVADHLGLTPELLDHVERGDRPVEKNTVEQAAEIYGLPEAYLINGTVTSALETLAERCSTVFDGYCVNVEQAILEDEEFPSFFIDMAERLRAIRKGAGYEDFRTAANAHGWDRSVYWAHETGGRALPADVFIGYCFTMGARPEYGILGKGPMWGAESVNWNESNLPEWDKGKGPING